MAEDAIIVQEKIWWQVYLPSTTETPPKSFGFATKENVITDIDYFRDWKGKTLAQIRPFFNTDPQIQVVKVCTQLLN